MDGDLVRKMLAWASEQTETITEQMEASWCPFGPQISQVVSGGLLRVTSDSLRARRGRAAGKGRGLEYWRLIVREYKSKSVFAKRARITKLEQWPRCKDLSDLRLNIDKWEHELSLATEDDGRPVSNTFSYNSLLRILPPT